MTLLHCIEPGIYEEVTKIQVSPERPADHVGIWNGANKTVYEYHGARSGLILSETCWMGGVVERVLPNGESLENWQYDFLSVNLEGNSEPLDGKGYPIDRIYRATPAPISPSRLPAATRRGA